jgi:hypothetical protein
MLIDYNPRLYNQLAFDIARGLPIPQMMYASALAEHAEVERLVSVANQPYAGPELVFCNTFGMSTMLWAQQLAGQVSASEARHWQQWRRSHDGSAIDPAVAANDPFPAVVDAASQLYGYARHPRAFMRKVVFDRTML